MEMLSNAVLSDIVSRSVSFLLAKKREKQTTAAAAQEHLLLRRLRHLLLRSGKIVEEAERRHVTNPAMLRQLESLRDEMLRGYYVLDAHRCQGQAAPRGADDAGEEEAAAMMSRHASFALSRFNPAKRVRVPSGNPEGGRTTSAHRLRELRQAIRSLEAVIGDMKEFVVLLASYPPLHRQPDSAHLFTDRCMFGRHTEKERVMGFLLRTEEPPGAATVGVLPIVGPAHIGKSTLVEHVLLR